jgi:peptidoglycan hydrolase-like protein with peptidoglycan-binding domain
MNIIRFNIKSNFMKKYIVLAVVFSLFVFGFMAPKVQAVTLDELQAQIQILSTQVAELSSQLAGQAIGAVTGKTGTDTTALAADQAEQQAYAIPFSISDLKRGDTGKYVTNAQNLLKEGKYYSDVIDGIYGSKTVNAVMALQKAKNLPATGVVDLATKKILFTLHVLTPYEKYATDEINKYIKDNNVLKTMEGKSFTVVRDTTNGQLIPSKVAVTPGVEPVVNKPTCTTVEYTYWTPESFNWITGEVIPGHWVHLVEHHGDNLPGGGHWVSAWFN